MRACATASAARVSPAPEKFPGAGEKFPEGGVNDGNLVLGLFFLPLLLLPVVVVVVVEISSFPSCGKDARGYDDDNGCPWYECKTSKEKSGWPFFVCLAREGGGRGAEGESSGTYDVVSD